MGTGCASFARVWQAGRRSAAAWAAKQHILAWSSHRIPYFGTADRFAAVHRGIAQIEDPVIFHRDTWYTQLALLETADLLLVLEQAQQAALLEDLLLATTRQDIDIFAGAGLASSPLAEQKRVRLFFWEQAACDLKIVLDDALLARAKAINLRYSHLYAGVAETAENREAAGFTAPSRGLMLDEVFYEPYGKGTEMP